MVSPDDKTAPLHTRGGHVPGPTNIEEDAVPDGPAETGNAPKKACAATVTPSSKDVKKDQTASFNANRSSPAIGTTKINGSKSPIAKSRSALSRTGMPSLAPLAKNPNLRWMWKTPRRPST